MTDRAKARGYKYATAFISSKPAAGFNHKEYGVTSEGVNTFLKVALEEQGTDPFTEPFTVKLTGGTNGDVAGNMVRCADYSTTAMWSMGVLVLTSDDMVGTTLSGAIPAPRLPW
jgi:NAD-specific glutamate dehydrogenase